MPSDLLTTVAECAIAFAGFSALAVIVPQLAGVPWRGQMATGLWLMVSWSLCAFFFALLPLVLAELGLSEGGSLSGSSGALAVAILVQGGLAANRDRKLARQGRALPTETVVFVAAGVAVAVALALAANAFGALPGNVAGWYVLGVIMLLCLAIVPLSLFLHQLGSVRE